MIQSLLSLMMSLSLLLSHMPQEMPTVAAMKSGVLLRMHVVAQDNTPAMQQVKYTVRDAVRQAYAASSPQGAMLTNAQACLPALAAAAREAAAAAGFTGEVSVTVETASFDQRTLDGLTIPAGDYPALMIRLGDARGRNWWGLIDPELALSCAAIEGEDGWDWSLMGFLRALFCLGKEAIHE